MIKLDLIAKLMAFNAPKQRARSLGVFVKRYDLPLGVRVSPAEFEHGESTLNLPLYGLSRLGSALN